MLQTSRDAAKSKPASASAQDSSALDLFRMLFGLARRHLPMFVAITAVCIMMGALYVFTAVPLYTATATMIIDIKKVQIFQKENNGTDAPVDAGTVQTQVELLKSQNVSRSVIEKLHLTEDPEFVSTNPGLIGSIFGLFGSHAPPSENFLERRALGKFEAARTVTRLGQTYVMEVSFKSHDPNKAAQIANAIVDAYVDDQLAAKYQATRRASVWLQDRVKELRSQTTTADAAVVNFKNSNNIVETGGKLMNEQLVGEVNTQLILSEAATAEAKARFDRISEVLKQPIPDASVTDALKNEVIIKLRQSYLDLAAKESIWSAKYGVNHGATVSLRTQMLELRKSISDEMRKIALSYESDYNIAKAREESIRASLTASVGKSKSTSQAQIELRNLESTSASYKSMYDILLTRYMEAVQQQSFPISEARLISPAVPPNSPSQPKKAAIMASTLLGAIMLSFGAAFGKELIDRVFRSGKQIEEHLGLNCIATLPTIKAESMPASANNAEAAGPRQIGRLSPILRYTVAKPFAQFTEALRSAKIAVDVATSGQRCKIVGVTSTLPAEGKTTASANLAQMIAHAGGRVLLVDADLRNPSLTRALAPESKKGIIELLGGSVGIADIIWIDAASGLHLLTTGGDSKLMHTNEILASEKMATLFQQLQAHYDYIVIDCAPLAPVVDTRAMAHFIDHFIYVIEWGSTKIDVVQQTLEEAPEVLDRVVGAVLNKADMTVLGRYETHRSNAYYKKYYARYGYHQ